ncbi:Cell death protease [Pseudogymnoascus destructans]|uniref:Carboxypeptidase n=2 Tax=Pseudogymnoascus destructans TaxID=655981 RepID=L8G1F4_PSED2|nr:Cell death protease [Pseudogymnoascus destructans]ELR06609.1 hypothetical protein GMDG_08082 [Pseudogymnoascus destructans 20631-21]OAF59568.1 Cell death protease [Pseudogymnoascus destructans]
MRLSSMPFGGLGGTGLSICAILSMLSLPSTAVTAKSAGDYFVHSLPGAPEGPLLKMHAGFVEVDPEHNGNLFFWHYQNRHIANRQRTVIWLNGGPGCSSEDGALMEIGPYRLKDDSTLEYNDGSWDEFANIMFVDNPVGTGFSYADTDSYVQSLQEMADQFIIFLEKWFVLFPEYEHDDLYIAGESYAGQHIPYIAKAIMDRNKKSPVHTWILTGLLIGNGWISPVDQYPAYLSYAYKSGLITGGTDVAKQIESQQAICIEALDKNDGANRIDTMQCEKILQEILRLTQVKGANGEMECVNMYDIRLKDTYPSCGMNWPPDLKHVEPYLARQDVLQALNMGEIQQPAWTECNSVVGSAIRLKDSKPSYQILPEILAEVPIVLFSGEQDLICNHVGTEDLINNMEWNGGKGFEVSPGTWAPRRSWTFEGETAGFYQEARNLTYVLFHNSSHMVPFDYARRTRDMLDRFMQVDIANIGGKPTDSRIDGEKGPETSVGAHPNSTLAQETEKEKLNAAKWSAYYKSGEVALVVVVIMAAAWGWYIWRDRRKRAGYTGLFGGSIGGSSERLRGAMGLENSRHKRGDVETGSFEDEELEELHLRPPGERHATDEESFEMGSDSEDDDERANGNGMDKGKGVEK